MKGTEKPMPKFNSKSLSVEAYVVTETEGKLQATTSRGVEQLVPGDALISVGGQQYALPGALFAELFEAESSPKASKGADAAPDEPPAAKGKGGQHASATKS